MAVDQAGWFIVVGKRVLPGQVFETRKCFTKKRIRTVKMAERMESDGFTVSRRVLLTATMDFCIHCSDYVRGKWVGCGREVLFVCPKCERELNMFNEE